MRISHDSKFLDGVNYQLHYGFDFGEHQSIPGLGLQHDERLDQVRKDFSLLAAHGIHSVRMNVFTDGRTGILYNERGSAIALQDAVAEGVLKMLRAAEESNILVGLVLLDHKFAERSEWIDSEKPELGTKQGHGRLLLTRTGREELMKNILHPLLRRIGEMNPPNLLSFELVNEPESLIEGLSTDPLMQMRLPARELHAFKDFMRTFRDLARQETGAQFTVGSLALKYAGMWLDVLDPDLDYLSIHYYGTNGDPRYGLLYRRNYTGRRFRTVKRLQEEIPVVWGEYAANGSSDFVNEIFPQGFSTATQFLQGALQNGIKGAYAWALRSGLGGWGDMFGPVPLVQHRRFIAANSERIEFAGGILPAPGIVA